MIASEAHPFAASGGLAEVVGALPRALARLGHRSTIIIPQYSRAARVDGRAAGAGAAGAEASGTTDLALGGQQLAVTYHRRALDGQTTLVLVDIPGLFDRDALYGTAEGDYPDNAFRFAAFSRAALEYVRQRGERPSIIHAHDWQAGLVPAYQKMLFSDDPVVGRVPAVFTIHNLAFQGIFPAETVGEIGLPWDVMHVQAMEWYGRVSYLKAGINFSERITTVSPGYAAEALSPEGGFGFHGVLERRADDFSGILNGIDVQRWDPATDAFLPARYDAGDLSGKAGCKRALLEAAGLDASPAAQSRPLIGLVSRMTDQKGFDLLAAAADDLMALDASWVLLGSGEPRYEELWTSLAGRHPGRVAVTIGYDERLEHLIVGGADLFLMPSRFEPCGLNQLNSLRYGTLPIVRATGGLDDTVQDADAGEGGNGFKFAEYSPEALTAAVRRALATFGDAGRWRNLQENAMRRDLSWDESAREYVKVYRAAIS